MNPLAHRDDTPVILPPRPRHPASVSEIRAAEDHLLSHQTTPDELMRSAAHAVATVAHSMIAGAGRVVVLAGSGGNGGDGLYAGAELASSGYQVEAVKLGNSVHSPALEAFVAAGGSVVDADHAEPGDLVIDAIAGIGGSGGLRGNAMTALSRHPRARILAVDVPSGVAADTGACAGSCVQADTTVTFGEIRYAHVLNPACGRVVLADIGLRDPAFPLLSTLIAAHTRRRRARIAYRVQPRCIAELTENETLPQAVSCPVCEDLTPTATDDKYTSGVVGICAGSPHYPGAGLLCSTAAVRATSGMVRYIGTAGADVVRYCPSLVWHRSLADAGRVQALVVGPGRGNNRDEMVEAVSRDVPVVLDADALGMIGTTPALREQMIRRSAPTVITPHKGEFTRLAEALGGISPVADDPIAAAEQLADVLQCVVVLKGRATIVAGDDSTIVIDTASSWAATPGTGDILAGIIGARLAYWQAAREGLRAAPAHVRLLDVLAQSVAVHACAAQLAATTPWGMAPTSADQVLEHIQPATAALMSHHKQNVMVCS